nr:hypothetical protein [Tanacetum cinerariifolium]
MATTIEQQVALDEDLVPSVQRAFLVMADVPEIYIQEFWAIAKVHQHSIRFKMDTKKHIVDLESFREMLHISPRVPGQSFAELPFEEEILERNVDYAFLIWEDLVYQVEHKNQKKSNEMYYLRFTKVIIHYFMTKKPSIPRRNRVNWHYVRDDILFSTSKTSVTPRLIRSTMLVQLERHHQNQRRVPERKKGGSASSTTPPTPIATPTPTPTVVAAPRLSAAAKDEGTGSKPGVPDVPSNDSAEDLSWNSYDDEDVDTQTKGRDESEGEKTNESDDDDDDQEEAEKVNDDDDNEEEVPKIDEQETTESDEGDDEATESDRESEDEETREQEEESFDLIPRTPEESEDDDNNEEDQGVRIGKEERMHEEEEADELYRDVDINQGRGLQVSQETEDSHVILTPTQSDAQQESSSTSLFMTNLLNPIIDPGMESIFTTSSTTITPIPSPQSTMTPSIISTFTTASQLPIPPTQILSLDLQSLPTFASVFCFEDRVKLLEVNFSNLPGIVNQYMHQQMSEAFREAEGPSAGSDRGSKRQREGGEHASSSTPYEPATGSAGRSTTGTQSQQLSASESAFVEEPVQTTCQMKEPSHLVFETGAEDQPIVQTSQHPECVLAKQTDARSSFNELLDTPIDFSNFIMNRLSIDTLTPDLLAGPTYELMRGLCNSLTELEYHLEEVYKATTDQLDWVNPEGQQYPHNLLQPLPLILDNQGRRVIPFKHFINNDLEYLWGGASSRKYTTSVTKTKAADYGHIKWIKELVPRAMWIQEPINYDKHALWGVSHWGRNVSSSMDSLLTENLLLMYTPKGGSSLPPISRLWNGTTISI